MSKEDVVTMVSEIKKKTDSQKDDLSETDKPKASTDDECTPDAKIIQEAAQEIVRAMGYSEKVAYLVGMAAATCFIEEVQKSDNSYGSFRKERGPRMKWLT